MKKNLVIDIVIVIMFLTCLVLSINILSLNFASASLGVTPPKVEVDFQPGFSGNYSFQVIKPDPDAIIKLSVSGDLSEYVSLDKETLIGGGLFTVSLILPNEISVPGKHRIEIVVKEVAQEFGGVTPLITFVIPIEVNVPYPGKYLVFEFKVNNVNVGDPIVFRLDYNNLGKEDLEISTKIEIFEGSQLDTSIKTMNLEKLELKSQKRTSIEKSVSSDDFKSGIYTALATVDYGKTIKAESRFRLGTLFVNITDYTKSFLFGKINKMDIQIENLWNSKINNLYAEVDVLPLQLNKTSKPLVSFKTPSVALEPWEIKTITGFFDTSELEKGDYKADITLLYEDKTTNKLVDIEIKGKVSKTLIITFVLILILLVMIIIDVIFIVRRKKELKKSRRK